MLYGILQYIKSTRYVSRGTILKDFQHFWVNVTSNILSANQPSAVTYPPLEVIAFFYQSFMYCKALSFLSKYFYSYN